VTARPKWFAHANVNCSDLDASERFYVEILDLNARWRTEPSHVQDGAGFGMPGAPVQWEGAILTDRRGLRGPAVDLLRWIAPATSGEPYSTLSHVGFRALQFTVEDLDAITKRLDAEGLLVNRRTYRDDHDRAHAVVTTRDPGSTAIELIGGAAGTTYTGVRLNCSDLDASVEWYRNSLGLAAAPNCVVDVRDDHDAVVGRFRAADVFVPHHPRSFRLELTEWIDPLPTGAPYAVGNHTGVYRVALTVDDIDVAYSDLRRALPDAPAPVTVDLGETLGPMRALFFTDPDGCVVELLEQGLR
jgi:catechol 2,3-dioxygenase-like lactoylglutathione lyase family enzyme